MKKKRIGKLIFSSALSLLLCFSFWRIPLFAAESGNSSTPEPFDGSTLGTNEPNPGSLTDKELEQLKEKALLPCLEQHSLLRHSDFRTHYHSVGNLKRSWNGVYDWKIVAQINPSSIHQNYEEKLSFEASNGWNATIGFAGDVLSAKAGFNVNSKWTVTKTYSVNLLPGEGVLIKERNHVVVYEYDVVTMWCIPLTTIPNDYEYGTAKAIKFDYPEIYGFPL